MSTPYVGEIRMFGGNFAPRSWAFCDGQLLAVSQYDALFSLLGTIYGGDGRTTFGLPDMRGRLPVHFGQGTGLSPRPIGQRTGTENVTLTVNQLASHSHSQKASTTSPGGTNDPANSVLAAGDAKEYKQSGTNVSMSPKAIGMTGGSRSHTNLMPTLCVSFIIALVGVYPSRN